jgi:hypothetical protein
MLPKCEKELYVLCLDTRVYTKYDVPTEAKKI